MDTNLDVQLIVMPFGAVTEPTIGVSLLKAAAEQAGFSSNIRYFSLNFAERIGFDFYHKIIKGLASRSLVGDWIFSEALFREHAPDASEYEKQLLDDYSRWVDGVSYGINFGKDKNFINYLQDVFLPGINKVRNLASDFVEWCVEKITADNPRVVGFSSSSHQACSCLAVARRLKEISDLPTIVFGGANCHAEMGLQWIQSFPWIDYICTGEGDTVFPEFLSGLLHKNESIPPPGFIEQGKNPQSVSPEIVMLLDKIPKPNYSDYLKQLKASSLRSEIEPPLLPVEMSRGCWWGEKNQCLFCGNNKSIISYRIKSPESVVHEILSQSENESFRQIICVDDTVSQEHIHNVFPQLQEKGLKMPIFCQTRPDLSRDDLLKMRRGGVRVIQPGVESFSDRVLKIMRKGRSGLQNIELLRRCLELGIWTVWNILYGFSGEPISEYDSQKKLIPLITHLQPPLGCTMIALKRFSPYWSSPEKNGLVNVRPWPSYRTVYPLSFEEIKNLAYFFEFDYADGRKPFEYSRGLRKEVGRWIELWKVPPEKRPHLSLNCEGQEIIITDTRPCASQPEHKIKCLSAKIYKLCDTPQKIGSLKKKLGGSVEVTDILERLEKMKAKKILVERKGSYLALAVNKNP